jgi:hypothetical protein
LVLYLFADSAAIVFPSVDHKTRELRADTAQGNQGSNVMLKIILGIIMALSVGGLAAFEYDHSHHPSQPHPTVAPEIDPAGAMSAFTLLAGGLAVLRGRRSRQQ